MDFLRVLYWLTCGLVVFYQGLVALWREGADPQARGTLMRSGPAPQHSPVSPVGLRWKLSSWSDCGSGSQPVRIRNLTVEDASAGIVLRASWEAHDHRNLTAPPSAEVSVRRRLYQEVWLPVPCSQGFGSCQFEQLCSVLARPCDPPWGSTELAFKQGQEGCLTFVLLPSDPAPFWVSGGGDFLLRIGVRDYTGIPVVCVTMELNGEVAGQEGPRAALRSTAGPSARRRRTLAKI